MLIKSLNATKFSFLQLRFISRRVTESRAEQRTNRCYWRWQHRITLIEWTFFSEPNEWMEKFVQNRNHLKFVLISTVTRICFAIQKFETKTNTRGENECKREKNKEVNLNLMFWFVKCLMTRLLNSLPFFANFLLFDINVIFYVSVVFYFYVCMCSRSFNARSKRMP